MSDSPTSPPPPAKRKPLLLRIYPSTWLIMLLAAGVIFFVEFPGHQGKYRHTYSHGWPLVWMEGFDWGPNASWAVSGPLASSDAPIVHIELNPWEERKNPWSFRDDMRVFDIGSLSVDLGISVFAVALAGWLFQIWRKRHGTLLRFRLRTLLGFFALVALLLAPVASWHRQSQREKEIVDGIKREAIAGLDVRETGFVYVNGDRFPRKEPVAGIECTTIWSPPDWLPDSVAKVSPMRRLFDRVSYLAVRGDRFTEKTLAPLSNLSKLEALDVAHGDLTESGFQAILRLTGLRRLWLREVSVIDLRLEQLSALSKLEFLALGKADVSDAGLRALSNFSRLECLWLTSPRITGKGLSQLSTLSRLTGLSLEAQGLDAEGVVAIRQLKTLEGLELRKTHLTSLRVDGLPQLSDLSLVENANLASVDLRNATPLQYLTIKAVSSGSAIVHPVVHLGSVDRLKGLSLSGVILTASDAKAIGDAPCLHSLELQNAQFSGTTTLSLGPRSAVMDLTVSGSDIDAINLEGAANLNTLRCSKNPRLGTVRLVDLPRLDEIELIDNPCLTAHLDELFKGLAELPRLSTLKISSANVGDKDFVQFPLLKELRFLDLSRCNIAGRGLVPFHSLSQFYIIDLRQMPVSDEAVAALQAAVPFLTVKFEPKKPVVQDLKKQAALVRNQLAKGIECKTNPWKLADDDFACLEGLANLDLLDLSDTFLTDAGLEHLKRLPRLRELILSRTQVTDAAVRTLKEMPALVHVDIEGTRITDEGRRALGKLVRNAKAERN